MRGGIRTTFALPAMTLFIATFPTLLAIINPLGEQERYRGLER
jgi:hypothetical protein